MSLAFIDPPNAPAPAADYRNLAIVPAGHRLLVLAGQIGNLMDGSIVEGLEAQYEQALSNIRAIVASEGGAPDDRKLNNGYSFNRKIEIVLRSVARSIRQ